MKFKSFFNHYWLALIVVPLSLVCTLADNKTSIKSNPTTVIDVDDPLEAVATDGGKNWIAVGWGETIMSSSNSIDWIREKTDTLFDLRSIAYNNGLWITVGDHGKIFISTNMINWVRQTFTGRQYNLKEICFHNGQWVAIGARGNVLISSNGMVWREAMKTPIIVISGKKNIAYSDEGIGVMVEGSRITRFTIRNDVEPKLTKFP